MLDALDRTLRIMRVHVNSDVPDAVLLSALRETTVRLVASERALQSHTAQCAFATTAILMARSGHRVILSAPDVPLVGPQPPINKEKLISGLLHLGPEILPGYNFCKDSNQATDLTVVFGECVAEPAPGLIYYIGANRWSGYLSRQRPQSFSDPQWPFGALAAAGLAAAEAFKKAMRTLSPYASTPIFDRLFAIAEEPTITLAPEDTPTVSKLGEFDLISGGAITNAVLFALARIPHVDGDARIIENETIEATNLNRYMLMLKRHVGILKGNALLDLKIDGLRLTSTPLCYKDGTREAVEPFAPSVLVGVDHIPSRWLVQTAQPSWLGIAATEGYEASASFHTATTSCAGCCHPEDGSSEGPIPTVAFVSFFAGLSLAAIFTQHAAASHIPLSRQQSILQSLRGDGGMTWTAVPVNPACPVTSHEPKLNVS